MSDSLTCYIYRSSAKADMYVYLREKDDFDCLPDNLLKGFSTLHFAMELELSADRKLIKEDALTVLSNLASQGFHIQMPNDISVEELLERIASENLNKNQLPEQD